MFREKTHEFPFVKTPMSALLKPRSTQISIRRARTDIEIEAAQHLRYKTFFEEFGATPLNEECETLRRDIDTYDAFADHLIVINTDKRTGGEEIIGTYRLLRQDQAAQHGHFNSSAWYDLTPLLDSGQSLLELSRSCVLPEFRTRNTLKTLWQGIGQYIMENNIEIMFGCASFHGVDTNAIAPALSYLHHNHLSPSSLRCKAHPGKYESMNLIEKENINIRKTFHDLPPLIKGYLRVGSSIGEGAVIDPQFSTIDTLIIMQPHMLTDRYKKHYDVTIDNGKPKTSPTTDNAASILSEEGV